MRNRLTVGEVAGQAGVTPKTVRYYEEIGLLPLAKRGPNSYRYFQDNDLNRLLFIQRAKRLGLSLDEIRELVGVAEDGHCNLTRAELAQILNQKIAACTEQIDALITVRGRLLDAAGQLEQQDETPAETCCPTCSAFSPTCSCIPRTI